jgi:Tfp pilus assembly protein PilX
MVVILLLLSAIITIFATSVIRNTVFFHDISLKRQEHEYQFRAAEALLNYGIAVAQEQFEGLKEKEKQVITFTQWPSEANNGYSGKLSLQEQGSSIAISATLYRGSSVVKGLSCRLKRGQYTAWKVSDWRQSLPYEAFDK